MITVVVWDTGGVILVFVFLWSQFFLRENKKFLAIFLSFFSHVPHGIQLCATQNERLILRNLISLGERADILVQV